MGVFLTVLILIVGALLALVILVQNPKGGGLAAGFGGVSQVGGVQKTTDFLEKATWYLGILLFVLCLISARFAGSSTSSIDATEGADDVLPSVEQTLDNADSTLQDGGAANTDGGDN